MNWAIEILKAVEAFLERVSDKEQGESIILPDIRQAIADLEEKEMQRQMRREGE